MKRSITLRNVCACAIFGALEVLAEAVRQRLGSNHHPCPDLLVLKVEEPIVPLCIELRPSHAAYGFFTEHPHPYNPWGKRVLGVSVRLCDACPHHDRAGAAPRDPRCGQCHGCAHACCSELTVYITQLPEFPLPPADVDWFFYHYFNMHDLAAASIPQDYRYLYEVARQFDAPAAAPLAGPDAADGTSQPAQRRGPGAPPLDCNTWLYEQMCALSDPRACGHLRPHWQELYLRQMGVPPAGWEKSFREAVRYCLRRIQRARGEPGSLPAGDRQDDQQGDQHEDRHDSETQDNLPLTLRA